MKTRRLTAEEVMPPVSADDISKISFNNNPDPLLDKNAADTIDTALKIRGYGANLFICGPSAPERLNAVLSAAAAMPSGEIRDITAEEIPNGSRRVKLHYLSRGDADAQKKAAVILSTSTETPVIIENNPIPENLSGNPYAESIEAVTAGSILKSSGGILIINAEDIFSEEDGWKLLKRVMRTSKLKIGDGYSRPLYSNNHEYKIPEIPVDLKVVMLGNESHYDHLYNNDEDFREQFQFFAELDSSVDLTGEALSASVNICRNYSLNELGKQLTDQAAYELVKYSCASAENNTKLSTIISDIEMVMKEAAVYAGGNSSIEPENIVSSLNRQSRSFSLLEQKIIEDIETGEINLKVEGYETGKVNGLAVIDKGPWSFGFPGLISARIAPGENGLVNIEHEAGLSGEIHDKWVLILEGFLRSRFALDFPLSIFASICFEQSYSEIDGDSASSSELYALLSAIADVPLRQDIAVTGSLSQTGEIQAVGGLREKIEGFYKVCRALNFTGNQGVIVPERNIKNIVLPDNIIEDIEKGMFHIYPVSTVNDSMELLTGMEAGQRNTRNQFSHGTLNNLIEKNLKKLASQAKNFGN